MTAAMLLQVSLLDSRAYQVLLNNGKEPCEDPSLMQTCSLALNKDVCLARCLYTCTIVAL